MRRTDKNKSLSSAQISILHLIRYVDETSFHASSFINNQQKYISTAFLHLIGQCEIIEQEIFSFDSVIMRKRKRNVNYFYCIFATSSLL